MSNSLTMAEVEALMLFIGQRPELWERHAEEMGLINPMDVDKKRRLCTDPARL